MFKGEPSTAAVSRSAVVIAVLRRQLPRPAFGGRACCLTVARRTAGPSVVLPAPGLALLDDAGFAFGVGGPVRVDNNQQIDLGHSSAFQRMLVTGPPACS